MNNQSAPTNPGASPSLLVEAYLAAWNSRDGARVVASLAPGGTYVDPLLPGPVSGDALAGYVATLTTAMPDLAFTGETFDSGQHVTLRWTMTGSFTGPLPGVPGPTGASFALPGLDIIEVGPDGINSVDGYFDQLTLLRQLGVDVTLSAGEPEPRP